MRIASLIGAGLALVAAGGLGEACSIKTAAPFPDVMSFCKAKATAECQVASTCGIDPDDCQTVRVALCNSDATDAMANGTREYVQGNAQACINLLNASNVYGSNNSRILYAQLEGKGSIADVCGRVFSGSAQTNKPCQTSFDCAGDNICSPVTPGQSSLICAPMVDKDSGDFCSDPGSTCATDTYCSMPSAGGGYQCEAAKQDGQGCDATTPCVSTERCAPAGTCEPRVAANKPCASDADCLPTAPYCDPNVGKTCAAGLSFANGAPDCSGYRSGGDADVPTVTVVDSGTQGGE
jgi:hypothetical protein